MSITEQAASWRHVELLPPIPAVPPSERRHRLRAKLRLTVEVRGLRCQMLGARIAGVSVARAAF
jgi:hypothetical protein